MENSVSHAKWLLIPVFTLYGVTAIAAATLAGQRQILLQGDEGDALQCEPPHAESHCLLIVAE